MDFEIRKIKSKKAVLGNLYMIVGATLAIALILTFFIIISGAVKLFSNQSARIAVQKLGEEQKGSFENYMGGFFELTQERFLLNKDRAIDVLRRENE